MKRIYSIFIVLLIFSSLEAQVIRTVVKFQPLDIFLEDKATRMLERRIDGNSSITFGLGLAFDYETKNESTYTLNRNYGLDIGYRRFFASILDDAPMKFYLGVNVLGELVQYEFGRPDELDNTVVHSSAFPIIGGGVSLGDQYVLKERFAFDIFLNPIVKIPLPSDEVLLHDASADNIEVALLRPGIGIGIAIAR